MYASERLTLHSQYCELGLENC